MRIATITAVLLAACTPAFAAEKFTYQTDARGMLVPKVSYPQFLERTLTFFIKDLDNGWAVGNEFKDKDGKPMPAYIYYAFANAKHELGVCRNKGNAFCAYPRNHSQFIRSFLAYWRYTGNPECLARARQLAAWNLAHRTPANWKYGSMFYSTIRKGQVGGGVDGNTIMTDKPAMFALLLVQLSEATGEAKYREGAEAVATTLVKTQLPEGNWPFRVNPQTGAVREQYTSNAIAAVRLFEALDGTTGNRWSHPKTKALHWILEGPAKTMKWTGFYEDIPAGDNRTNWDCIETARYLIAHRADDPQYLPLALKLHDWIAKEFVDKRKQWASAEGLREQKRCFFTMGSRTVQWAALVADLFEATGDESFKQRAINSCALATCWTRDDGANLVGPGWMNPGEIWFACHFNVSYMFEALAHFPTLLDDGRPHMVRAGGAIQDIAYQPHSLSYKAICPGQDLLLLPSTPAKVTVAGQALKTSAWNYDGSTKTITLARPAGRVEIAW